MPRKKSAKITLTEEQEAYIIENSKKMDLKELTQKTFGNSEINGNSKEGRVILQYLKDNNLDYKTSAWQKIDDINLSEEEKLFIRKNCSHLNSVEIARILWPEAQDKKNLTGVSKEAITVQNYIKYLDPEQIKKDEELVSEAYFAPRSVHNLVPKMRKYLGFSWSSIDQLNKEERRNLDSLLRYMNDFRFLRVANSYQILEDQELFESSFMSMVWDKPDLTQTDIQSYITLAGDYVILHESQKQKAMLDKIINESLQSEDKRGIGMTLVEMMEKQQKVYENTTKRISDTIKNLEGTRNERIKNRIDESRSFLVVVEAFKKEESRREMIRIAEYEKQLVEEETEKLERASDYVARLFGASREELAGG